MTTMTGTTMATPTMKPLVSDDIKTTMDLTDQNLAIIEDRLTCLLTFINGPAEYPTPDLPQVESFATCVRNAKTRSEHAMEMLDMISNILGI